MGANAIRAGAPVGGTQAADGTDNDLTDPRIILFSKPVSPCVVYNKTGNGNDIIVKINTETTGTVAEDFSANPFGHFNVKDGESVDASIRRSIAVESISFVTLDGADDLDNVSVVGWN